MESCLEDSVDGPWKDDILQVKLNVGTRWKIT